MHMSQMLSNELTLRWQFIFCPQSFYSWKMVYLCTHFYKTYFMAWSLTQLTFHVHNCIGGKNRHSFGKYCNTYMLSQWITHNKMWYKNTLHILCTFQIVQLSPCSKYWNLLSHDVMIHNQMLRTKYINHSRSIRDFPNNTHLIHI